MPAIEQSSALEEFAYLTGDAAALGVVEPVVTRVTTAVADGRTVSALRFGSETPNVVFLHGAGLNAHTWDATVLSLGEAAIVVDLPGHGESSWREDLAYSPAAIAADVTALLTEHAGTRLILVGQSLGGLVATHIAADHPSLVERLIIVDITPGISETGAPDLLKQFYEVIQFGSRDEATDRAVAFGLGGSRERAARGVHLNTRVNADGSVSWKHHLAELINQGRRIRSIIDPAAEWAALARVSADLTLVQASAGTVTDEHVAEFRERAPHAAAVTISGPHNLQESAFTQLAALIHEGGSTKGTDTP